MYKCFKKSNGEWVQDTEKQALIDVKKQELKNENYSSWTLDTVIKEYALENGLVRVREENNNYSFEINFYDKDSCGTLTVRTDRQYYFKATTEELEQMNNEQLKQRYDIIKCEQCGEYVDLLRENVIKIGRNHYFCSTNCASEQATRCNHCGKWYMKPSSICNETVRDFCGHLCMKCFERLKQNGAIRQCADCGEWCYSPQRIRVNGEYNYYCSEHARNHITPRVIRGYHDQHCEGWQPQNATYEKVNNKTYRSGFELECECGNNEPNDIAYEINQLVNADKKLFEFEHDGSLANGYETISQPCTMAWYFEHKDLIKQMLETMAKNGCKSHNTNTCGLHVHIGRNFFNDYKYEDRFVAIFYHLKNDLIRFSRRNINRMGYCAFSRDFDSSRVFECKRYMTGHGTALNLANEHTIEVRIFKGTLDFSSLMACIELCYNISCYVKDHEELTEQQLDRISFMEIVNYQPTLFLHDYLQNRNFFDTVTESEAV